MSNSSLRWPPLSRFTLMCALLGALTVAALTCGVHAAGDGGESQVKLTATTSKIDKDSRQTVTIKMHINEGWHAYANPVKNEDLEPNQTVVKITSAKKLEEVSVNYPAGHRQMVLKDSYQVYEGNVEILATVKRAPGDASPLEVTVNFVTCNDKKGICLPPETVKLEVK